MSESPFPRPGDAHLIRMQMADKRAENLRMMIKRVMLSGPPPYNIPLPDMSYNDRQAVLEVLQGELAAAGWTCRLDSDREQNTMLVIREATEVRPA